ncbi:MAG: hypothetical protein IPP15_04610 [Saprospiraceae bacterium]|uniref:Uncharacterized protein n=1 Tax=Candidatus Opimibacter skivensis TaxID=2982028 RepID=A0A9D7STE6_9BACT|nr:hypothetical protein [Candidatus Opimibacter skivensis]
MAKKQPDYTADTNVFQKSMQAALANLDKVTEDAKKAHEKAIEMQIAAKEEIHRIELEAETISRDFVDKNRKEIEARLRDDILFSMVRKLVLFGMSSNDIMKELEVPAKMMADAWNNIGFAPLGKTHVGHVAYEEEDRAGNVIFYREDIMLKFGYEFRDGLSLAFINVPKAEKWKAETGLPLDDRLPILNFIGERVIRDKAEGYKYEIQDDAINITLIKPVKKLNKKPVKKSK